jgi:anaerobic selenocysteine-containing dehydrogenase
MFSLKLNRKNFMSTTITRRDILKFTGGGILGIMLSPLPWKLIDDSAIWTQNWSLIPKLPHGPITTVFSHCTLCPGGCAIKTKCVSGMPYYVNGVQNHPVTHGTICTRGLASHHIAHHPLRIVHPHKFVGKSGDSKMIAISYRESLDEIAKYIKKAKGSIAILDQQPNRAISEVYREFLNQTTNGMYLTPPSREDVTVEVLKEMMNRPSDSFGFDFENTKMILSFGAPLFDGWGTPGRMTALRRTKNAKFIQVESRYSRTAMQSDEWIALRPGTEKIIALNIAYVLIHKELISRQIQSSAVDFSQFKNLCSDFNPENTSSITGIDPNIIHLVAQKLATSESAIVMSGADPGGGPFDFETEKAIASLNLLIGNVGKTGGIISRKEISGYKTGTESIRWSDIPDHSISVLFVDGADSGYALPWSLIKKKLILDNNFVVSLSPILNEISAHSDYIIPSPACLESLSDIPTPIGNSVATFALSTPLLKKQEYTTEPIDVIKEIASRLNIISEIPTIEELLKQKVEAIHSQKRGSIFVYANHSFVNVKDISSPVELWTKLTEGAVWIDESSKQTSPNKFTFNLAPVLTKESKSEGIPLIAYGWRGATSSAQISPILSKVFQETELRNVNGVVSINPTTAQQLGMMQKEHATLTTKNGSMKVIVKIESTVRPGIIEASIAPLLNGIETPLHPNGNNILNLCEVTDNGTWRITTANLLKA